ncbi:MAG: VOC family protein [Planctomycetota bacterium]|nr:VOC family protein [Planctomycetota bacterium]
MTEHPPRLRAREMVVLARDHDLLVRWYVETLGFQVVNSYQELPYANLESGEVRLGIGSAPPAAAAIDGTVVPQIETDDVSSLLRRVHAHGGSIDGPHRDHVRGFDFGAFRDPEGNAWWVVDADCP